MTTFTPTDATGTSFQGNVITTNVNTLRELLGTPDYNANDFGGFEEGDKTNYEWARRFTHNGRTIRFNVYDYEHRAINQDEVIEFHIGAMNDADSAAAFDAMFKELY